MNKRGTSGRLKISILMYGTMLALVAQGAYEMAQDKFRTLAPLPDAIVVLLSLGIAGGVFYLGYWYNYLRKGAQARVHK